MANSLIKWIMTNSTVYAALATKDTNALYWLEDTQEIYKGATAYTQSTVFYAGTLPAKGAQGKIYIESTTLKGSVWNGSSWTTVIQSITQTVVATDQVLPVSGKAVADYVAAQGATIAAQAVTDITYDETAKAIKFIKDGNQASVPLTKLGTSIAYDGSTGVVTLLDAAGTSLSTVNIPLDNFVKSGLYDDTAKAMVLTMQNGGTVSIPAVDLIKIYHASETDTVDISIQTVNGSNVITATVKVSATANNALVANADGLYVDKEAILKIADVAKVGKVVTVDANGHAISSEMLLTDLATNVGVAAIKATLETNLVAKASIVTSGTSVNLDAPSDSIIVSEKALVDMLTWSVLS